jgi:hypothetical protein
MIPQCFMKRQSIVISWEYKYGVSNVGEFSWADFAHVKLTRPRESCHRVRQWNCSWKADVRSMMAGQREPMMGEQAWVLEWGWNQSSESKANAWQDSPVKVKNDEESPKCCNFVHGDWYGLSSAQKWSSIRFLTELLACINTIKRARYFHPRSFCQI